MGSFPWTLNAWMPDFSELRKCIFFRTVKTCSLCQIDIDFLISLFLLVLVPLDISMLFLGFSHPDEVWGMKYCFLQYLLHHNFNINIYAQVEENFRFHCFQTSGTSQEVGGVTQVVYLY